MVRLLTNLTVNGQQCLTEGEYTHEQIGQAVANALGRFAVVNPDEPEKTKINNPKKVK